jgi:hypothetical protein
VGEEGEDRRPGETLAAAGGRRGAGARPAPAVAAAGAVALAAAGAAQHSRSPPHLCVAHRRR